MLPASGVLLRPPARSASRRASTLAALAHTLTSAALPLAAAALTAAAPTLATTALAPTTLAPPAVFDERGSPLLDRVRTCRPLPILLWHSGRVLQAGPSLGRSRLRLRREGM